MKNVFTAFIILMITVSYLSANNGKVAYAYPINNITVDGSLTDWPKGIKENPIDVYYGEGLQGPQDFAASFLAGYNLKTQTMYLAIKIIDDSYNVEKADDAAWDTQDNVLLYIDKAHKEIGSGVTLFIANEHNKDIFSASNNWDPDNYKADWKNANYRISRVGNTTIYEWSVSLGHYLEVNKSIGFDILLCDIDDNQDGPEYKLWGDGFGKSRKTGRLGDLVFVAEGASLSTISGKIAFENKTKEPLPSSVIIINTAFPKNWIRTNVDSLGSYTAELPAGNYMVKPAFNLTRPFESDTKIFPLRFTEDSKINITVSEGKDVDVEKLLLKLINLPVLPTSHQGLLYNYTSEKAGKVSDFIKTYMEYYEIPGVSVALVKDGKIAYHKTFGTQNNITGKAVNKNTLFEAASITKPVFAYAAMKLYERGLLDLDKPLYQYLPFPNFEHDERYKKITARIVLSHKSGIDNWNWGFGPGGFLLGEKGEMLFDPGSEFGYSGEAINYLGRVLEKITGKDLNTILNEEVNELMGLKQTHYVANEELNRNASLGHYYHFAELEEVATITSPASSMHTEAADFSKFMIGLMEHKGMAQGTYDEMTRTHTEIPVEKRVYKTGWEQSLGLGIFMQETPYGKLLEHGGNNGDFQCKFGVFPEIKSGYVIFTNSNLGEKLVRAFEIFILNNTVRI